MMNYIKKKILHPLKMGWYNFLIATFGAWNFFCKQQKRQEMYLTEKFYKERSSSLVSNDIVFTCNDFIWSGGLADRLKGIIAVYDWCNRNNRPFKINFCSPFRLQDYLIPNEVKWVPDNVCYDKEKTVVRTCLMEPRTCNKKEVIKHQDELLEEWMDKNLKDTDKQIHIYSNMYRLNVDFSNCFQKLFKPCSRLQEELVYHKMQIGGQYISISFRFTTLLGDFTDCTGAPLLEAEREQYITTCLEAVNSIRATAPAHHRILITADSSTFLSRVQQTPGVYVIPGKVGHIDYDSGDDVNMKTFLDFLMIADAKAVYLVKHGRMYGSAFAKTAACVHNRPFHIFEC